MTGNTRAENNVQPGNNGSGISGYFTETIWRPFVQSSARTSAVFIVFIVLLVGALVSTRFLDTTVSS
ncbi:O-glucosyltransferase rumi protein [Corchorus olitorius]|uniref:O-glucosyltransferase rumi protein n=1 Tax=Corchorus olitorius TaxID=93759 RepID=A0A1R3JSM0_9ROSI|nr:O-glucosyltransferase rumi protein [Corchorus olitorius]